MAYRSGLLTGFSVKALSILHLKLLQNVEGELIGLDDDVRKVVP